MAADGAGENGEIRLYHRSYLNKQDRQMRFNNGCDPLYVIFDKMDQRPLSKIAKDFVKELKDICVFKFCKIIDFGDSIK